MTFWKKLFGSSLTKSAEAPQNPQTKPGAPPPVSATKPGSSVPPETDVRAQIVKAGATIVPTKLTRPTPPAHAENEWQQFFGLAPIHESGQSFFKSFVGAWPAGVEPSRFAGSGYEDLVKRLQALITGPYPVASMSLGDDRPKPDYRMVNGKIARCSSPFIDMLICGVIPRNEITSKEPHIIVWRLIEKHSSSSLAKLLFTLPRMTEASKAASAGKAGVLVLEDVKIQVYKGIENVIFSAYEDLPEGGYLNDRIIEQKLRSLLTA